MMPLRASYAKSCRSYGIQRLRSPRSVRNCGTLLGRQSVRLTMSCSFKSPDSMRINRGSEDLAPVAELVCLELKGRAAVKANRPENKGTQTVKLDPRECQTLLISLEKKPAWLSVG